MFEKILIANRGEIALRVIRTCKEMGIKTVAVYSQADVNAMHVRMADESVCIGPAAGTASYLSMPAIIAACEITGAEAIHPGYGFLSENANFAKILEENKIKFIGASAKHIEMMGDKIQAKKIAKENGLPVIEGSEGGVKNLAEAKELCKEIGFPILIKASGGGGGKGMRIVEKEKDIENQMKRAISEATSAFGDGSVFVEKYVTSPRHIEIQIMADNFGNIISLGERDCSVQRRHQKIIEESPSPVVDTQLRTKMGEVACLAGKVINYSGAGTIEFLLDKDKNFYFLEMNTRVQVEHPVTEMVTGVDIIKEQIWIAFSGETALKQSDINPRGHAIECRINAEDASKNFQPSPGVITMCHQPSGFRTRVDGAIFQGYKVTPYYDSMVCKLICHGRNRLEAIKNYLIMLRLHKLIQIVRGKYYKLFEVAFNLCLNNYQIFCFFCAL